MATGVQVWSGTASNNSTSDTNINWAEGMAPSQVNDSARAMMASVAKWRDDNNATIATGGTTVAFTATTNQTEAALTDGYTVTLRFNATADTSATLAVDSLAAKPMQLTAGTNLLGSEIQAGDIVSFTYSSTGAAWVAHCMGYQGTNDISNNAVTYAKLQQVAASSVIGNLSTSSSTAANITIGAGGLFQTPVVTTITSTATATWQSTTQNGLFPAYLRVRMVGGGGGGGAATTNNGNVGSDTSFSTWTAIHGNGGATGTSTGGAGGTGGVNGTGTLITRIAGGSGQGGGGATSGSGGMGGGSAFGGAGGGGASSAAGQSAAANSGSGGGGGGANAATAGAGGGAGEFVEFLVTSPSTSYTVQVGPGGTGGSAGVNAGGNGAAGRIEVIAYWQ